MYCSSKNYIIINSHLGSALSRFTRLLVKVQNLLFCKMGARYILQLIKKRDIIESIKKRILK